MEQRQNEGVVETGIAEKTRQPAASSGTIPTCENPERSGRGLAPGHLARSRESMRVIEVNMERRRNEGRGKREISEKTRRLAASFGTIPTYENPVTRPGKDRGKGDAIVYGKQWYSSWASAPKARVMQGTWRSPRAAVTSRLHSDVIGLLHCMVVNHPVPTRTARKLSK
ncbi:hypothetical protein PR048_026068 [Dryococelus australis]|uniref:Uncharacterized protein n=1 Tax=Dryococelus australis TaxID=614101 RepID=A0ABQ9GKA1_9NEOP|nr:hypothetical protein PR048_026068 [Dryococelus australis]